MLFFSFRIVKMTASYELWLKYLPFFLLFRITAVHFHYFLYATGTSQHQSKGEILDAPQQKTMKYSIMKMPQLLSDLLSHGSLFI